MARFGSIGTQYFDSAGDPLENGKLHFYESGTLIRKNTFADVNLSIANSNPVLLSAAGRQPNIFFNGSARVILTNQDDEQIEQRDPIGGEAEQGVFSPWNSITIYSSGDIVEGSNGNFYISVEEGNQNNDPATGSSAWTRIRFIRVWNSAESYEENAIVQGSGGSLYRSLGSNNLGNNPVLDLTQTFWGPVSESPVASVVGAGSRVYSYRSF